MSQNTLYCFVELKGTRGVVSAKANAWLSDMTSQKYSVMIGFEKVCLLVMQDLENVVHCIYFGAYFSTMDGEQKSYYH